jgi:hypothetical protein
MQPINALFSPDLLDPDLLDPDLLDPDLLDPDLLDSVTRRYGQPVVATLPPASLHDDPTEAFTTLHSQLEAAEVVLFADIWPGDLDAFFRLRLVQVLAGRAPLPSLSIVVLSAAMTGPPLAGGFAYRFRSGWPFARCIFLTKGDDHNTLSALLGLPVGPLDDPAIIASEADAGQAIALQVQPAWGRCGSTILFENQLESLVQAGFFTIRVFTDPKWRHGPTLRSRLDRTVPENSVQAGAHVNAIAVPDGLPFALQAETIDATWRSILTATASCRIRDDAVAAAGGQAACAIVNRLECLGPALAFAPGARMLLSLQEDRTAAIHQFALLDGRDEATALMFANAAEQVQTQLLGIADICTFVSSAEMTRLAPWCRRAVTVRPRVTAAAVPQDAVPRLDLLVTGAEDALNVASLRWFLDEVWRPHLEAHGVSVAIAGRVGRHVLDAAAGSPLVHFLGFVDDLDAIRSWCRLSVVPDLNRAGISAKLLDTLAACHPVATTTAGLRGLEPSVAGVLPAFDTAEALATDILTLIRSPAHLAERQLLVRQVQDASRQDIDHAALVMAVPRPSGPSIRKRLERWSRLAGPALPADAAAYSFGFDVAFPMSGSPYDSQVLLDGWHQSEPWGRWTDGAVASLRITLGAPADEPLTLALDIVPSAVGANLRIGWDGTMLALIDPVPGANLWDIPTELSTGKTSFVISLHAGETVRPATGGASVDDRILGIGVSSVRVSSRQPTLCQPGVFMPIRAASMPRQVLLTGWHAPEEWGCWTSKLTASLRLTLPEPASGSVRLELELTLPPTVPMLTLVVNGTALPAITPATGRNRWDLPTHATNGRTELHVQLSIPETYCAARADEGADDRELGIGLRGIRLVPFVPAFHEPGTRLRLARPQALEEVLRDGWHPTEDWGCWTSGQDAVLRLAFHEPLFGLFRLEMDLAPRPVASALTVSVNGQALPAIVPVTGSNSWTLPERLTEGQPALLIALHVSQTFCPAAIGPSTDDRVLGVGVRWITLHRHAAATCPIGSAVAISSDLGDRGILVAGWHKLEPWGCWSSGPDAAMLLCFDAVLAGPYVLEVDMMPPLLKGPVILSVNGERLDPVSVSDGPNEWALPQSVTDGQSMLDMHLLVALPVRPSDVRDSKDGRVLGVGVRSFRIRPLS